MPNPAIMRQEGVSFIQSVECLIHIQIALVFFHGCFIPFKIYRGHISNDAFFLHVFGYIYGCILRLTGLSVYFFQTTCHRTLLFVLFCVF